MQDSNDVETIITLQQVENIYRIHNLFGKVIDLEMNELYNSGAFKAEAMSGSLRIFPKWMQEKHSSRLT